MPTPTQVLTTALAFDRQWSRWTRGRIAQPHKHHARHPVTKPAPLLQQLMARTGCDEQACQDALDIAAGLGLIRRCEVEGYIPVVSKRARAMALGPLAQWGWACTMRGKLAGC